ncbi:MAG: hypothetical protein CM15mP46_7290 [Alphaproteobacteria bacterium]|nr:MAG: hypothetical protein CM15mP46_7290 [Alphaproteobacteria bacterium]
MKAMFGMLDLRAGSVLLDGEDITTLQPQHRVQRAVWFKSTDAKCIHVEMTVEENLVVG